MRAKILGAIALLLLAALAHAQTTGNAAGNITGVIQKVAHDIATPIVTAIEVVMGVLFWGMVVVVTLYIVANYVIHRSFLGGPFGQGPLYWLIEHVKSIIVALALPFIVAFIIGAIMSAVGAGNPGTALTQMFLRSLTFGQSVFT